MESNLKLSLGKKHNKESFIHVFLTPQSGSEVIVIGVRGQKVQLEYLTTGPSYHVIAFPLKRLPHVAVEF